MEENEFLENTKTIVLAHLDNITVEKLAKQLNFHPAHLYRKINIATTYSPSVFIRNIRLEESKVLLKSTNMLTKDIAYAVGFNTPSYFIECFRQKYNVTPENFRKL